MKTTVRPRLVVLGGGFAGLEASTYARRQMPAADITLLSDKEYFVFKPNNLYIPFGMDPGKLMTRLAGPTKRQNIHFVHATARDIDPISRRVSVEGSDKAYDLQYDFLIVATGLNMRPVEIPGMAEYASAHWTIEDMMKLRTAMHKLVEDAHAGSRRRVLFLVSPYNRHPGPLYEMAMMMDNWLRRKQARDQIEIAFATYEASYVETFGLGFHKLVESEFRTRAITGYTDFEIEYIEPSNAMFGNGERLAFDLLVAFPPCAVSTGYSGLLRDERGYIATEPATRQAIGNPDVYAVGDAADFHLKQALLAFQQADVAAEHITARVLGIQPRFDFDGITNRAASTPGKDVLGKPPKLPGGSEQELLNTLAASSKPPALYKMGPLPPWMLARKMVGAYLPWRFKAGNPFHENAPWKDMEMGLRLMSSLSAR